MKITTTLPIELLFWRHKLFSLYCDKAPVWAFFPSFKQSANMQYKTKDGRTFAASGPKELVQLMRADSKTESEDDADFMVDVSRRCYMDTNANVRTSSYEDFVDDLMAEGFIEKI